MTDGPSRPRSRAVWIAVAVGVACVAVVAAALVLRDRGEEAEADGPRPVLTKPREADGYTLDRSDAARQYSRTAEKDLESQATDGNALVGTYEDGENTLIYVGFSFPAGSEQGDALDASPDDALTSYLASAGIEDTERFDPGPLGGSLRCGRLASGAEAQVTCAWADRGTLGSLRFALGPLADGPADEAAQVTVDFRAAAEPSA